VSCCNFLVGNHIFLQRREKGTRPLLGVQRWDMYSGKGATQRQELGYLPGKQGFLKDPEWHERAPFFCRLTADVDWVEHPAEAGPLWFNYPFSQELLQEAMDQEIRFAYHAGIDFFIYNGPARTLFPNAWELKNNLDCHMASTISEAPNMNFVWALYGHQAIHYTRTKITAMMDETMEYLIMDNWQTVMDNRPLVIVLWPERFRSDLEGALGEERMTGREFVEYIRTRVKAVGLNKAPTYAEATEEIISTYESKFLRRGLPFIPPCTSMQYPWPRALDKETGTPQDRWYHYQWPKKGDLAARIEAIFDFVATHPKACESQIVTMYSWNEHSEGGGLCPTMGSPPEYQPVTQWLDEVAEALAAWQYQYPVETIRANQSYSEER